jgi:hypothetical protein
MTLYLPKTVEDTLGNVPADGRSVFVQLAVIHYAKSADGKRVIEMLKEGYKPMIKP